jgi:hypothetical protein
MCLQQRLGAVQPQVSRQQHECTCSFERVDDGSLVRTADGTPQVIALMMAAVTNPEAYYQWTHEETLTKFDTVPDGTLILFWHTSGLHYVE